LTLTVVSGAPGTGKSTIARAVGGGGAVQRSAAGPGGDGVRRRGRGVLPLRPGGPLIEVNTGRPGAPAEAVAAVMAVLG
jgi:hypothetical protein